MRVLLTGAFGRVGTAIIDRLEDDYDWTFLDREDHDEYETEVADVSDRAAVEAVMGGHDAVVHLAADPRVDAPWPSVLQNNVIGCYNVLDAAAEAGVDRFVFASTNHVVGGFKRDHREELMAGERLLTRETPIQPDGFYGTSKAFGEALCRYYVDYEDAPQTAYAIRIGGLHPPEKDHPYDNPKGRSGWLSRRDCAHLFDRCLRADGPEFGIFYGVSDNENRWYDIEYPRQAIGYRPQDDAADY